MSTKVQGFVKRIGLKEGRGKRGPWKLWSLLIVDANGDDAPGWVSLGFRNDAPKVTEGDYVKLDAEQDDRGNLVAVEGSTKRVSNPPARNDSGGREKADSAPNRQGYSASGNRFDGTGIQNRTNPEDAKRITYASARTTAVEVIRILLENEALPVAGAKGKAGEATRFEQIRAAIDKLTVEFYNDGLSLRKLENVADAGVVNTGPDAKLPAEKVGHDIDKDDVADQGGDNLEDIDDDASV